MIDESKIIFIVSQPRAGSTLVQKLMSNNDIVDTVSEPWLLLPLLSIYKPEILKAKFNYNQALDAFFDYLNKKNIRDEFKTDYKRMILNMYRVSNVGQYFIDKTPRYYEILPEIYDLFPNAKFLILKRDPFASLYSMLTTWSNGQLRFSSLKNFYRDFLIAPYLIQEFIKNYPNLPNVKVVKYEEIVSNPEHEVKKLYDWLAIPFSPAVLSIADNRKVAGMFGDDAQKDQPLPSISAKSLDLWKATVFNNLELSYFFEQYQNYLTPEFLELYGYEPINFKRISLRFRRNLFKEFLFTVKLKNGQPPSFIDRIFKKILSMK